MRISCISTYVALFFLLAVVDNAHAYLDPGSGSMLLQLLLGGIAGLVVLIKLYWHRLLVRLGLHKNKPPKNDLR